MQGQPCDHRDVEKFVCANDAGEEWAGFGPLDRGADGVGDAAEEEWGDELCAVGTPEHGDGDRADPAHADVEHEAERGGG